MIDQRPANAAEMLVKSTKQAVLRNFSVRYGSRELASGAETLQGRGSGARIRGIPVKVKLVERLPTTITHLERMRCLEF